MKMINKILKARRSISTKLYTVESSTDDLPTIFNGCFSTQSQIHNRERRNMTNYNLRKNRTNFASKVMKTFGPGFWNSLPNGIELSS